MRCDCKDCRPQESPGPVWSIILFALLVIMVAWIVALIQPH